MHEAGGDGLAEADPHRSVGARVEAGTGVEARQLSEADIHRAGALGAEDRVLWHPGSDVAQGPEIIGRRLVIMDLRPDLRRVLIRLLCNHLPPWRVFRIEPLAAGERLVELPDDCLAVTDQRHFRRLVMADLLGRNVELDDLYVLRIARRLAEMKDPVEPRSHQEDDVGVLERQSARRRHRKRMVVWYHALPHRRTKERQLGALDEGADFVLGAGPGHALADENERPLGPFEQVQRSLDVVHRRHHAGRVRRALDLDDFVGGAFASDDVVGHVEVGGAGAAIDRVPGCHLDIIGDALDALDCVREFAERRGDQHLALFLESAHAAAIGLRGAAEQDHGPTILLGIGEAGETVHYAGAGHNDARAGTAGQIAVGLRRVGGGLLVAHADIGNAFLLRGCGKRGDRKPDDPEQVIDALLFEAPRYQGRAVDFAHAFLLVFSGARLRIDGKAAKGVYRQRDSSPFSTMRTHATAVSLCSARAHGVTVNAVVQGFIRTDIDATWPRRS